MLKKVYAAEVCIGLLKDMPFVAQTSAKGGMLRDSTTGSTTARTVPRAWRANRLFGKDTSGLTQICIGGHVSFPTT
jgi:hypothetical protein